MLGWAPLGFAGAIGTDGGTDAGWVFISIPDFALVASCRDFAFEEAFTAGGNDLAGLLGRLLLSFSAADVLAATFAPFRCGVLLANLLACSLVPLVVALAGGLTTFATVFARVLAGGLAALALARTTPALRTAPCAPAPLAGVFGGLRRPDRDVGPLVRLMLLTWVPQMLNALRRFDDRLTPTFLFTSPQQSSCFLPCW